MCLPNKITEVENGHNKYPNKIPKFHDELPPKKKILYMDEAISKTKFGLFNYIVILVGGISMVGVLFETCSLAFVLPVSQCDLNLTTSQKGIIGALPYIGIIFSSHLWGFLADTQGRRRVIYPTMFMAFLMTLCSSLSQNFYFFAVFRFLNGFFLSGSVATIYAYLSEFHNNVQRGRAIMVSSVIFGVLCIIFPLIAWSVINQDWQFEIPLIGITYKPWRLFIVVCSLPGFLAFIILTFLPESPKFVLGQGRQAEAYRILQTMNRVNNGRKTTLELFEIHEEPESIESRKRILESKKSRFPLLTCIWNQTVPLFKPPYLLPTMLICFIQMPIFATGTGFYIHFAVILNKMATTLKGATDVRMMMCDIINLKSIVNTTNSVVESDVCFTKLELDTLEQGLILEIMFASGFVVTGLLINRIGKFPIIFFVLIGTGLCGISCTLTDIPSLQKWFFITLMNCSICANILNAATVDIYPTASRAMAVSMAMMFARIGSAIGANFVAHLLDTYCELAFYLSGISLIVAGILAFFIPNIHQKVVKTEKTECNRRMSVLSTSSMR